MLLLKFLLAAFLFVAQVTAQCGPPQCYNGCTDARPQVDFVFLIDQSGSMQPKIDGVKKGLTTFAQSLNSNQISPKFSIVIFGSGAPWLKQQMTDFGPFKTAMYEITTTGGRETGLEAMSNALNIASSGNLGISFRVGQNTKKVFILVTNEDSDQAFRSANIFSTGSFTQSGASLDGACFTPGGSTSGNINSQAAWDGSWQREIDFVANSLIANDASLYMFVGWTKSLSTDDIDPSQTCKTPFQYCNPDIQTQNSDYTNFNAANTLTRLRSQSPIQDKSLQGRLLAAGKASRCFDVADTASTALVNNFFSQIVSDVSKCEQCYSYPCSGSSCLAPVYICDCAGVPNGPKVKDSLGNCCLPSQKDCAGICNGNSNYDACGVCTPNGALYSACKLDCNNTRYLDLPPNPTSIATYSNLIYRTTCPDDANYLLPNADLISYYKSSGGNRAIICQHFHTYGRFEGRPQCEFDTLRYSNDYAVTEANARQDWFTNLVRASPRTAYCKPGSRFKTPPSSLDNCGQCITNLDNPPYCVQDCSGVFRKQDQNPFFIDNCGYCVAPGTNADARKDDCGVCDGGNAAKNECGQCFGVRGKDGCNQNICANLTCSVECDLVSRPTPTKYLDPCGYCVLISTVRDPRCVKDCTGAWFKNETSTSSPAIVDECGNCVPRAQGRLPTCVQDCANTWFKNETSTSSPSIVDECGNCVPRSQIRLATCKQDCAENWYREGIDSLNYSIDDCGNCRTNATRNDDKDDCGICKSKAGYNTVTQCTQDCKGIYRLIDSPDRAFSDFCDSCWFANETAFRNYLLDACGYCRPSRDSPLWNSTSNGQDSQGKDCKCNTEPTLCADGVTTTCTDNCPEFNFCPGTTKVPDFCGRCEGNTTYYNKPRDDCGICCDPDNGIPCNLDKDDCGVCFGFNRDKKNPCNICLNKPGSQCVPDCAGVYGGNATYGCDGVCNSKAICSYCGNGIVEAGEGCDLGTNAQNVSLNVQGSGCTPNCVAESGNNTGSIIGGVIGGVAAVAFLGLAAFLAVKYAQKAGLIGSANKQVDMGASNTNPLYKSEVAVHQNPLYES